MIRSELRNFHITTHMQATYKNEKNKNVTFEATLIFNEERTVELRFVTGTLLTGVFFGVFSSALSMTELSMASSSLGSDLRICGCVIWRAGVVIIVED